MKKLVFLLSFLCSGIAFSDQISSIQFKGLNNNESSVIIDATYAQDLLNVDVTPSGRSFKKRPGYGIYKTLSGGQPLHGGFHSYDSSGNDVQIWGSSTSLWGIVGDGTPTQLVSSATLNSTWDCVDTQQNSYCVNSNRNAYIRTNGTTMSWFASPLGTMVESTPDRVVVAGVSGSPNTLFVSQSNTFTNFTVGINATDPFNEVIASPGSKITHIRWGCGKLLWWKDQSFGYFDFDDQFVAQVKTVSDVIGTFDNTSAIDPGGRVWFRGQDGHTWMYDCSILNKQSIDITPNVQASGKRIQNSWTQTTQADWQAGLFFPSTNFSTTISTNDIVLSTFTGTDTGSADFTQGTGSNIVYNNFAISVSTNNAGQINDNDFEATYSNNYEGAGWATTASDPDCGANPFTGTRYAETVNAGTISALTFSLIDVNGVALSSTSIPLGPLTCNYQTLAITVPSQTGKNVKYRWNYRDTADHAMTTKAAYIFPGTITFHYICPDQSGTGYACYVDLAQGGSSTITSANYTSRSFDTAITSSTAQLLVNWTANAATSYAELQTSANATAWTKIATSTGTNASGGRYFRYITTYTYTASDYGTMAIDDVSIVTISSGGTFVSAIRNSPNLTSWNTLGVNFANNSGSNTFYVRGSTNTFSVNSSTPVWTLQSAGSLITASTGTFIQFRDDFASASSTQSPTLNDFTLNWFEGVASDQAYMFYFDNAIWESVAFGVGQSTNNYIFKYDLINDAFTLYNFGAGGMLNQGNLLYFGSTANGSIYNYGTVTSDNGTAINAFWRSKAFSGGDPFLQNQISNIDVFSKKDQGTTLTSTYTTDSSTSTLYTMSLSTTNAIVQSRKLIPPGRLGYIFDLKIGDTSASSNWEILGYRIGFTQLPYRPTQ